MSDDALRLILQRLDGLDGLDERLDSIGHRLDNVEREQTRLRTDLLGQMERVLIEVQTFKDDMTVAMNYAARADVTSSAIAASRQRAL
ncbi:MAG TPA: hypothetical protein VKI44_24395 [Acetobacteraceae bacterium]|nr:hypothetical protein [Acetobacteraceae bacterium]